MDVNLLVRITGLCLFVPDPKNAVLDVLLLKCGTGEAQHHPRVYAYTNHIKQNAGTPPPTPVTGLGLSYVPLDDRLIDLTDLNYSPSANSQVKPSDFVADITRAQHFQTDAACLGSSEPRVAARIKLPPATFGYTLSPGNWSYGSESKQLANVLHCTFPGVLDATTEIELSQCSKPLAPPFVYSITPYNSWLILEIYNVAPDEFPGTTTAEGTISPGDPAPDFATYIGAMSSASGTKSSGPTWDFAPTDVPVPYRGSFVKCMLAQASR